MQEKDKEYYEIKVSKNNNFTLFSSDNKSYDAVYYMEEYTRNSLVCTYEITITCHSETMVDNIKLIALIGRIYGNTEHCTVIIGSRLAVLVDDYLSIIELSDISLITKVKILSFGTGIALYSFDDGLLVHGEIDVVKIDYDGNTEWSFSARDVWVTADGTDALRIEGDKIFLTDFEGHTYVLNRFGEEIS